MKANNLVALCVGLLASVLSHAQTVVLTGTVLGPDGPIEHGSVLVRDGRIVTVGSDASIPRDVQHIDVRDAIIAPGFIDLHNHMSFNAFPRWKPAQEFGARYDWQQKPVYNVLITAPHKELVELGLVCEAERYAELKALAQGETSTVGSERNCPSVNLTRKLDIDPGLPNAPITIYNTFPFQMTAEQREVADKALSASPHGSLLIHVSEGAPRDASAAREFEMFKQQGFMRAGVNIIHGVAIPAAGFVDMAKAGVGFVWSPRSNIELYGDTADVTNAHVAGVTMALAPDWSPTGSVGMLGELQYAAAWNLAQEPSPFTDRDLVIMATANPARMVGLDSQIGYILADRAADLVVVRRTSRDVYASLTHAAPQDVMLTIVRGQAVFGDLPLMKQWNGVAGDSVQICGEVKAFALNMSLPTAIEKLTPAIQRMGRVLAPLAECGE
ncbi:amidohydrolase family protein [Granulicella arctica]|uniref:Cytosine/adenosine deaminase-related metal-dependent hydrolase n=1 Tax=Granulicella arctica TaxID=940613 RepID=A0A7Y9TSJ1_9BACT|nr:cytosine/adenosine deaminase-related metal-dependent hydrolase [Granulicella arctica]